uniref:Uncharacterized protein n=1 Tax=Anguilla anguilla TaxID=7936 RepID=A0A0E9Q2E0_ANGAN
MCFWTFGCSVVPVFCTFTLCFYFFLKHVANLKDKPYIYTHISNAQVGGRRSEDTQQTFLFHFYHVDLFSPTSSTLT